MAVWILTKTKKQLFLLLLLAGSQNHAENRLYLHCGSSKKVNKSFFISLISLVRVWLIVRKGVSTPFSFQNYFPITRISSYPISHPPSPTIPANRSSQVFLINRNATVKLSSIDTIHVKQKYNVDFFIFKLTLKHMILFRA